MPELYDFQHASSARRVRIALAWKGLDYSAIPVALVHGEQHEAEFRTINPQGLLPVHSDGRVLLSQSLAIIEYLEETQPLPPLLPVLASARARARQFAHMVGSDIQPLIALRAISYLRDALHVDVEGRRRWFNHWLMEGLDALEIWLTAAGGRPRYCIGAQLSIADVCLVPQLEVARRNGLDIEEFSRLAAIEVACLELPAFQHARAAPPASP